MRQISVIQSTMQLSTSQATVTTTQCQMQTSSSSVKYGNQQSKLLKDSMQLREMQLLQNPLCTTGTEIKRGKESLEEELNSKPGAPSNDENVPKVQ